MENDIIFLDNKMYLCGYAAGMSEEERRDYCEKYSLHTDTYKHYAEYWREKECVIA